MREIVAWERIIKLANHISQCLLQCSTALQVLQCMLSILGISKSLQLISMIASTLIFDE